METSMTGRLLIVAGLALAVSACGGFRENLGLTKQSPDEFRVVRKAPGKVAIQFEPLTQTELRPIVDIMLRVKAQAYLIEAEAALPALWELVWAGEVTNDAFAPLRSPRQKQWSQQGRADPSCERNTSVHRRVRFPRETSVAALASRALDRTLLSTDDAEIRSVAERHGAILGRGPGIGVTGRHAGPDFRTEVDCSAAWRRRPVGDARS